MQSTKNHREKETCICGEISGWETESFAQGESLGYLAKYHAHGLEGFFQLWWKGHYGVVVT